MHPGSVPTAVMTIEVDNFMRYINLLLTYYLLTYRPTVTLPAVRPTNYAVHEVRIGLKSYETGRITKGKMKKGRRLRYTKSGSSTCSLGG